MSQNNWPSILWWEEGKYENKISLFEGVVDVTILLSVAFYSISSDAGTMDFNGQLIEVEEKGGDVVLTNGVTMISEDFLRKTLFGCSVR